MSRSPEKSEEIISRQRGSLCPRCNSVSWLTLVGSVPSLTNLCFYDVYENALARSSFASSRAETQISDETAVCRARAARPPGPGISHLSPTLASRSPRGRPGMNDEVQR